MNLNLKLFAGFPLTPALSLGERENRFPPPRKTARWVCPTGLQKKRGFRLLFPLPEGDGQGEGERAMQLETARPISRL